MGIKTLEATKASLRPKTTQNSNITTAEHASPRRTPTYQETPPARRGGARLPTKGARPPNHHKIFGGVAKNGKARKETPAARRGGARLPTKGGARDFRVGHAPQKMGAPQIKTSKTSVRR